MRRVGCPRPQVASDPPSLTSPQLDAIMKKIFDFLLPYKVILLAIGFLVNIALQYSPLARQFGEIAGNIALVVAWVMLSALALLWIDTWKPQNDGWTLFLAKNGLRGIVLIVLFLPILNFNNFTGPTITILSTRISPYEAGKPVAVELALQNDGNSPIKVHGHYNVLHANRGTNSWQVIEDMIWGAMMSRPEADYPEATIAASGTLSTVFLEDGPVLTQEQVEGLRGVDDRSAIYFLGVFTYSEWYGRSRRLEFCGSYRALPKFMLVCAKHDDWVGSLRKLNR